MQILPCSAPSASHTLRPQADVHRDLDLGDYFGILMDTARKNARQEDHADQDKYDSLSHTTSRKLAAQAAELTMRERQVGSLTAELHEAHEAAASHGAEVLRLQSALDAHDTTQADLLRHEAEEASWSVLRAELTHQAEHTRHLKAVHAHATAELSALRERYTAVEVLCKENHALERRAASADELRKTVMRREAEMEDARGHRRRQLVRGFKHKNDQDDHISLIHTFCHGLPRRCPRPGTLD